MILRETFSLALKQYKALLVHIVQPNGIMCTLQCQNSWCTGKKSVSSVHTHIHTRVRTHNKSQYKSFKMLRRAKFEGVLPAFTPGYPNSGLQSLSSCRVWGVRMHGECTFVRVRRPSVSPRGCRAPLTSSGSRQPRWTEALVNLISTRHTH